MRSSHCVRVNPQREVTLIQGSVALSRDEEFIAHYYHAAVSSGESIGWQHD